MNHPESSPPCLQLLHSPPPRISFIPGICANQHVPPARDTHRHTSLVVWVGGATGASRPESGAAVDGLWGVSISGSVVAMGGGWRLGRRAASRREDSAARTDGRGSGRRLTPRRRRWRRRRWPGAGRIGAGDVGAGGDVPGQGSSVDGSAGEGGSGHGGRRWRRRLEAVGGEGIRRGEGRAAGCSVVVRRRGRAS